jgi:hypothetical protein
MNEYLQYYKDLLNLYAKTGNKNLESAFLKFSAGVSQNILDWILGNKQLKNSLNDQNVYDALVTMYKLNGQNVAYNDLLQLAFKDDSFKKSLPYMVALNELSTNSKYADILGPLSNFFVAFQPFKSGRFGSNIDPNVIAKDLEILIKLYNNQSQKDYKVFPSGKMNLKTQRELMFKNISRRYSFDISNVANSQGLNDLADELKSGALLMPYPAILESYMGVYAFNNDDIKNAKKMADFFMLYTEPKYENYVYDMSKTEFLHAAEQLREEDYFELKMYVEKKKSLYSMMGEEDSEIESSKLEEILSPQNELNKKYLFLVSTFFVFLQKYLKMPSSFEIS